MNNFEPLDGTVVFAITKSRFSRERGARPGARDSKYELEVLPVLVIIEGLRDVVFDILRSGQVPDMLPECIVRSDFQDTNALIKRILELLGSMDGALRVYAGHRPILLNTRSQRHARPWKFVTSTSRSRHLFQLK